MYVETQIYDSFKEAINLASFLSDNNDKNPKRLRKAWLKLHLGKMLGGYISASTAFVVVNQLFSSIYSWFIPGIVGGFIIIYWIRKVNKKVVVNTVLN